MDCRLFLIQIQCIVPWLARHPEVQPHSTASVYLAQNHAIDMTKFYAQPKRKRHKHATGSVLICTLFIVLFIVLSHEYSNSLGSYTSEGLHTTRTADKKVS